MTSLSTQIPNDSIHGLRTSGEEIAFTARPKINSQSQVFRYGQSIFCLPHLPKFSDFFDLCLHWVSVVRGLYHVVESRNTCYYSGNWKSFLYQLFSSQVQQLSPQVKVDLSSNSIVMSTCSHFEVRIIHWPPSSWNQIVLADDFHKDVSSIFILFLFVSFFW